MADSLKIGSNFEIMTNVDDELYIYYNKGNYKYELMHFSPKKIEPMVIKAYPVPFQPNSNNILPPSTTEKKFSTVLYNKNNEITTILGLVKGDNVKYCQVTQNKGGSPVCYNAKPYSELF